MSAIEGGAWTQSTPTIYRNSALIDVPTTDCSLYGQTVYVPELAGTRTVCMDGDERLQIGNIDHRRSTQAVVQFPMTNEAHIITGICQGILCRYSADKDMLVTLQPVGQYTVGLVVYLNASKRVRVSEAAVNGTRFTFDTTHPDYEIKNDTGRFIVTPTFALSDNGDWIVTELRDHGLAILNTDTFASRQVTTEGYKYGYGFDPSMELAVSNDGKAVAATGLNAGFTVIDVVSGCGQSLVGDLTAQNGVTTCPSSNLAIGELFPNFKQGAQPHFYGNARQLEVIVYNWAQDTRRVSFLAYGVEAPHRLKMLSLGDSFTSGEGETDKTYYYPEADDVSQPCRVSRRAYPALVAVGLGIHTTESKSVACAGAQIGDIFGSPATYWGQGGRLGVNGLGFTTQQKEAATETALQTFQTGRALQLDFVERYNLEVLTIGIGGNDAGLMGKLQACAAPGTCEWATPDGTRRTNEEIARLFEKLGVVLARIKERSPDTRVIVVGYPEVIEPDGTCDALTSLLLNHEERVFMQKSIRYLNEVIHAAADKAGFRYANVGQSYFGAELCSGSSRLAMNAVRYGGDIAVIEKLPMLKIVGSETFHPTPFGHALVAAEILAQHSDITMSLLLPVNLGVEPPSVEAVDSGESRLVSYFTHFVATPPIGDDDYTAGQQLMIKLPDGTLQSNSSLTIEVHSEPTTVKTTTASRDGGLNIAAQLPGTLPEGIHTVHIFGTNRSGDDVDLYQFITVVGDDSVSDQNNAVNVVIDDREDPVVAADIVPMPVSRSGFTGIAQNQSQALGRSVLSASSADVLGTFLLDPATVLTGVLGTQSVKVVEPIKLNKADAITTTEYAQILQIYGWYIIAVVVGAGLIVVLLGILLLKKRGVSDA